MCVECSITIKSVGPHKYLMGVRLEELFASAAAPRPDGSQARGKRMTTLDLDQEQFCICCNLWGPAETMLGVYRFRNQEAKPCLWLHHHCAKTCGNVQFEAAMKRFKSQVNTAET